VVDRQAVALFQNVRRAVRLDLDGEKLTTNEPAIALPPVRVFRFSSVIAGATRCSPWVLGSSPVAFPSRTRPRFGEPRYFGPRPDSVVVPLAGRLLLLF
jgi:hypothetical protein